MAGQDLNIQPLPSLEFIDNDEDKTQAIFSEKTAYYMPSEMKIVFIYNGETPQRYITFNLHMK